MLAYRDQPELKESFMTAKTTRINLQETEIPTSWYNIQAD